jgi:hypothetical protein
MQLLHIFAVLAFLAMGTTCLVNCVSPPQKEPVVVEDAPATLVRDVSFWRLRDKNYWYLPYVEWIVRCNRPCKAKCIVTTTNGDTREFVPDNPEALGQEWAWKYLGTGVRWIEVEDPHPDIATIEVFLDPGDGVEERVEIYQKGE